MNKTENIADYLLNKWRLRLHFNEMTDFEGM